jgi:hypothetical protein
MDARNGKAGQDNEPLARPKNRAQHSALTAKEKPPGSMEDKAKNTGNSSSERWARQDIRSFLLAPDWPSAGPFLSSLRILAPRRSNAIDLVVNCNFFYCSG